jgi:integrase
MPRIIVPSYRLHKASGQARTIINGKHVYLGKFNSEESRRKFARLLAESAQPSISEPELERSSKQNLFLISEVIVKYLEFAETNYVQDGAPGKEFYAMIEALKPVNELYGDIYADEFGPLKLKSIRQHLIDQDLCRTEINKRIGRIKRVLKWAVSEELVRPRVYEGARTVTGLQFGRTTARESEPVKPVAESVVEETILFVAPQVAAMIRLQLLTGMRPSEVAAMTVGEINREGEVWLYEPSKHKNRWRGHQRVVPLGPKCQEVIAPFLDRPIDAHLFSPAEAEQWRHEQRAINRNRETKVFPCEIKMREKRKEQARKRKAKRAKGSCYNRDSYRRAIEYGVIKANKARVAADPKSKPLESWFPYQLRHTYATRMRKSHGVEAAQLGLGHKRTNIVDTYAEKNTALIVAIAKENG